MNEEDKQYFEELMTKDLSYNLMINLVENSKETKSLHNILMNHGLTKMAAYHAVIEFMNEMEQQKADELKREGGH